MKLILTVEVDIYPYCKFTIIVSCSGLVNCKFTIELFSLKLLNDLII